MGGGHGGCALLTRPTVMRLMSGFVWRVRFAYSPYGDEADVGFVWRVRCAYPPYENA